MLHKATIKRPRKLWGKYFMQLFRNMCAAVVVSKWWISWLPTCTNEKSNCKCLDDTLLPIWIFICYYFTFIYYLWLLLFFFLYLKCSNKVSVNPSRRSGVSQWYTAHTALFSVSVSSDMIKYKFQIRVLVFSQSDRP